MKFPQLLNLKIHKIYELQKKIIKRISNLENYKKL